jgi:hypothetical protein
MKRCVVYCNRKTTCWACLRCTKIPNIEELVPKACICVSALTDAFGTAIQTSTPRRNYQGSSNVVLYVYSSRILRMTSPSDHRCLPLQYRDKERSALRLGMRPNFSNKFAKAMEIQKCNSGAHVRHKYNHPGVVPTNILLVKRIRLIPVPSLVSAQHALCKYIACLEPCEEPRPPRQI